MEDSIDVNAWRDDGFGVDPAEIDDVIDLDNDRGGRRSHYGSEIARGLAVDQIAQSIRAVSSDQGVHWLADRRPRS